MAPGHVRTAFAISLLLHGAVLLLPIPDIEAPDATDARRLPEHVDLILLPDPHSAQAPAAPAARTPAPALADAPAPAPPRARPHARTPRALTPRPRPRPDEITALPVEADGPAAPGAAPPGVERFIPGPADVGSLLPADLLGAPAAAPAARFDPDAYATRIRARIDAHKRYPARARRRGLEGVATVIVTLSSAGHLAAPPRLARTSGVAALDREALRMARAAAPYPPPAGARATPLVLRVPVRFSLTAP